MATLSTAVMAIALHCAAGVDADLLAGFATVESANDPLVIHQNIRGTPGRTLHPKTLTEAVQRAADLIAAGKSVDTGPFQINSANLDLLDISLSDTFDPCHAAAAAARLIAILSRYNSGSPTAALAYAKRVTAAVSAVKSGAGMTPVLSPPSPPCAPTWDAWSLAACSRTAAPSSVTAAAGASSAASTKENAREH
jgi:hypothetical protein